MAWIELHDTLPDHPKVINLASLLRIDKDLVTGKLVRLWTWALTNRESGAFSSNDAVTIAETMRYKGKPETLVSAMVDARLLDQTEDGWIIHDWDEHVCMLMARREKVREQSRERKRKQREKETVCHAGVTRDERDSHAVTVPKPYLNHTNTPTEYINNTETPSEQSQTMDHVEKKIAAFEPPTLGQVTDYCIERGNKVNPKKFHDFYESKGWMIGKNKMKSWKAAVRTWEEDDSATPTRRNNIGSDSRTNTGTNSGEGTRKSLDFSKPRAGIPVPDVQG